MRAKLCLSFCFTFFSLNNGLVFVFYVVKCVTFASKCTTMYLAAGPHLDPPGELEVCSQVVKYAIGFYISTVRQMMRSGYAQWNRNVFK